MSKNSIDKILFELHYSRKLGFQDEARRKAKQALKQLILDVIGEDEPTMKMGKLGYMTTFMQARVRNKYRAEQREKIERLFK